MAIAIYEDLAGRRYWADSTSSSTIRNLARGDWLLYDDTPGTPPPVSGDLFDAEMDERLANPASASSLRLRAASVAAVTPALDAVRARTATDAPTVVSLLAGQPDETIAGVAYSADMVNFKVGDRGVKITAAGAGSTTIIYTPAAPISVGAAQAIGVWVYVPDLTNVTSVATRLYSGANLWERSVVATNLKVGWNLVRFKAAAGVLTGWGTVTQVRVLLNTTGAAEATIGHIWAERRPKASLLFIADRGYRTFVNDGLPDLRALGVPVTWALDPALHGTSVGTKAEVITDADVEAFAAAGDSISLHSYDGSVTSTMTPDQIRADAVKGIRHLQQRGYPGRMWRAAWTQNSAPQHAAAQPYFLAYATPNGGTSVETWPPVDRWNIARWAIHGRVTTDVDAIFGQLQQTNGVLLAYTHGVHPDGGADCTPAQWDYFASKVQAGIDGGWLEGVTFETLYARSGGRFVQGMGRSVAEYLDESGAVVRKDLL